MKHAILFAAFLAATVGVIYWSRETAPRCPEGSVLVDAFRPESVLREAVCVVEVKP